MDFFNSMLYDGKYLELLPDKNEAKVDINDILLFGRDKIKHDTNFKKLTKLSHDASLKLNMSKSKFRRHQVKYQGQIVSRHGMSADSK